jgi:hypothetical protein
MTTEVRINKTEAVRGILKEMGALVKNPPEGWANQVQAKLTESNINVSKVRVYQIRTMTMSARKARMKPDGTVAKTGRPTRKQSFENAMEHLSQVADFANSVGGLDNLEKTIQILKKLKK